MIVKSIILSAVMAGVYAFIGYAKNYAAKNGAKFNPYKFTATILVGVGVGAVLGYLGLPVKLDKITNLLAAYTGVIVLVQEILKFIVRTYFNNIKLSSTN